MLLDGVKLHKSVLYKEITCFIFTSDLVSDLFRKENQVGPKVTTTDVLINFFFHITYTAAHFLFVKPHAYEH